jgi:hypothetical protein
VAYQALVRGIVESYPNVSLREFSGEGEWQIPTSEPGLFYAFGALKYKFKLKKGSDGSYILTLIFTDVYDFHVKLHEPVPGGLSAQELAMSTILAVEQHFGVINPYTYTIHTTERGTCIDHRPRPDRPKKDTMDDPRPR